MLILLLTVSSATWISGSYKGMRAWTPRSTGFFAFRNVHSEELRVDDLFFGPHVNKEDEVTSNYT